jgi:hypothetical protein
VEHGKGDFLWTFFRHVLDGTSEVEDWDDPEGYTPLPSNSEKLWKDAEEETDEPCDPLRPTEKMDDEEEEAEDETEEA